jgi:hypothetical protein
MQTNSLEERGLCVVACRRLTDPAALGRLWIATSSTGLEIRLRMGKLNERRASETP